MKKMKFPISVNVRGTKFIAGEINEVEETPGSVQRWLIRGCTIVEEKKEKKKVVLPKEEIKVDSKKEVNVIEDKKIEKNREKKKNSSK